MDDTTKQDIPHKDLPFDNLFLNSGYVSGFNNWWMYVFTTCFTILCYLLAPALTSLPLLAKVMDDQGKLDKILKNSNLLFDADFIGVDKNIVLMCLLGIFIIAAIGLVIGVKKLHKKTLTSILTGYEKFRFKRFWFAFSIWGGLLTAGVLISYIVDPGSLTLNFNLQGFLISTVLMLLFMPIQTGWEETLFRGYLVQGLSQVFKNGIVPVIITSFLFGAAHMSNPEVREFGWPIMLTYYVCFALFMGCLTLLDEGLELAMGIHFANNFISSVWLCSPSSVLKTYSVFETKSEDPYSEIVLWFCMAAVTFVIFWLRYRWRNFKLIIK